MKKLLQLSAIALMFTSAAFAQDEGQKKGGFQKQNLFTGGNVALGFGSGQTNIGVGPYFGYSFNKYLDVAFSVNYNYVSQRDYAEYGDKIRQSVIGPGIFARFYPVKFLFAQAQVEENFTKIKYIPAENGYYAPSSENRTATSFLIGPGYAGGRGEGGAFYYISVLFDVAKNTYSPYVDDLGRATPIVRAGINIPLFGGPDHDDRYRRRRNRDY